MARALILLHRGRGKQTFEYDAIMVYEMSSRTSGATQRNPIPKKLKEKVIYSNKHTSWNMLKIRISMLKGHGHFDFFCSSLLNSNTYKQLQHPTTEGQNGERTLTFPHSFKL